jgi:hypothetical protein
MLRMQHRSATDVACQARQPESVGPDTHILARIRVDTGNGATVESAPAPSSGTVDAVYITAGTFTVTITATLITGTVLQAVATINVVS